MPTPPRSDLRFWFRGSVTSVTDLPTSTTVLRWLRDHQDQRGTKEGCGEGDCGACTVVVADLDPGRSSGLRFRAVNSCLMPLAALDGRALFTVEDLASGDDLHPVQRALVDLHASQCGFCTPGFAMSLWADYQDRLDSGRGAPTAEATRRTLSGNLCRCTGYRPLVEAAEAAWGYEPRPLDSGPVVAGLARLADAGELRWGSPHPWVAPRTEADLARWVADHGDHRIVAGSTDLGLRVTKGLEDLGPLVSVLAAPELRRLDRVDGALVIGAAVCLEDAFAALTERHPALAPYLDRFASRPVRQAGTLGGNLINGSPIGDGLPVLLVLGAELEFAGPGPRRVPLTDFYLGYQKNARRPGEVLVRIHLPPTDLEVRAWKVSKRHDQDISAVSAAFAWRVTEGRIAEVRAAFGGLAATAHRAPALEAALIGQRFTPEVFDAAAGALGADFAPLTDGRATAAYRLAAAGGLVRRLGDEAEGLE